MDSNFQFLVASPSEGDGTQVSKMRADLSRNRRFESISLQRRVSCELAPHGFGVERAIGNGPEHVDQTTFRSWDAIISKGATVTASMRCWPPPATTSASSCAGW